MSATADFILEQFNERSACSWDGTEPTRPLLRRNLWVAPPGVERGYERLTGALHTAGELERDWIVARAAEWKGEDMGSQSALIRSSNKRGGGNDLEVAGRKVRADLPQIGPTLIIKDQAL